MKILFDTDVCEFPGCEARAEVLVYDDEGKTVTVCCRKHATEILERSKPYLHHECKNCGCLEGIG